MGAVPKGVLRAVLLPAVFLGAVAYGTALVVVSLQSRAQILPPGTPYRFCGFYLDCHLSAAVEGVDVAPGTNGGERYTVRLRFANSARRATLTVVAPRVRMVQGQDVVLAPVASVGDVRLSPDSGLVAEYRFEAPFPLAEPRLQVTMGSPVERLTELFLIGDPESLLHQPVLLAIR